MVDPTRRLAGRSWADGPVGVTVGRHTKVSPRFSMPRIWRWRCAAS